MEFRLFLFLRSGSKHLCGINSNKKTMADHCGDSLVAIVSGCTTLLCLIVMILLVMVVRCVRNVLRMVSEVLPLASTLSNAITSGTHTSGGDDPVAPRPVGAELWAALGVDARAVVAVGLGWLASRC